MRLVFAGEPGLNATMEQWAIDRIPHMQGAAFPGGAVCAAVVSGETVLAVVAFYNYQAGYRTMQVSCAAVSRFWARPHILAAIYRYAFETAGVNLLWVGTPADNEATLRFLPKVGLKPDSVLRDRYGPGRDAAMFSMTRAEWARAAGEREAA